MSDQQHAARDPFPPRHLGSAGDEVAQMLDSLGLASLDELTDAVVPAGIRAGARLDLPAPLGEAAALEELRAISKANRPARSVIGMGYSACLVPAVIQRNVLENPGWYTQYTPYQAEIAQGRLEALINFQTLVCELTGLPVANASLLDEATAAAEAIGMCWAAIRRKRSTVLISESCHPQTLSVVETRAEPLGIRVEIAPTAELDPLRDDVFAALVQYPTTDGAVVDYRELAERLHEAGNRLVVAADPLALVALAPPGSFGADVVVGSTQRLGLPMGGGGPHAGYLAAAQHLERLIPGRIAGVSRDAAGDSAYRLARQTREQHIRRDKATSNICTAQVLPAVLTSMYAVYHGPDGLRAIANRVHHSTLELAERLAQRGFEIRHREVFDTLRVAAGARQETIWLGARDRGMVLRRYQDGDLGITLDEVTVASEIDALVEAFGGGSQGEPGVGAAVGIPSALHRTTDFLPQEVFHRYHTEHEMLRYLHRLESRDLSLVHSMIPLGSCTMKLNATAQMIPVSWEEFGSMHPFAPAEDQRGYERLCEQLEAWLAELTGFDSVSLQPNAGSQGELSGLLVIRAYHRAHNEPDRDVCLIPTSAHGTNPASAVMAGLKVIPVECDANGDVDLGRLRHVAAAHSERLAALMITYPSTHGVFEESIKEVCEIVHEHGGQVYLDGANLNAQIGLCRPGDYGADVCHLNLHKTFCIPHGGGGPGMGPICVAEHLAGFLPGHPFAAGDQSESAIGPVSAAPWGSPSILPISWMYIAMMGAEGLTRASRLAILNANYMAKRLSPHYPILYSGANGFVAHEFIIDVRGFKQTADVTVDDIAKRLMDYGFHAPTMSWPVAGTMMIEPTESESKAELDRFCDALVSIREEIREIEDGRAEPQDNLLKNAPHTAAEVTSDEWRHPYPRRRAAFPLAWLGERKFWPPVARIDNAFGDRNLVCTCDTVTSYAEVTDGADSKR
ncbi:MAG: aminomethyl-transferring glycine dehydrogenase [Thermoanaerobaculia bacterium]